MLGTLWLFAKIILLATLGFGVLAAVLVIIIITHTPRDERDE